MKECTSYKLSLKPAILDEAQRCFAAYGIRAVKMDDIARNLGISKRTVYELYSTKEDLICEVVMAWHAERDKRMAEIIAASESNMDILIGVLSLQLESAASTNFNFFKDVCKYPKAAKAVKDYFDRQCAYSAKFFEKGVEEGDFLSRIDYGVFNRIVAGTMDMLRGDDRYEDLTYKDLFSGYLYVMIRGFCTAKGVARIDKFATAHLNRSDS